MYSGDGTQGGFNIKVVTTKRPCIPVAPLRDDRSTFICTKIFIMVIAPNNTVVLLNYKKLYGNNYGDEETLRSKYFL